MEVKVDSDNYMVATAFLVDRPPKDREEKHVHKEFVLDGRTKESFTVFFTCMGEGMAKIQVTISDHLHRKEF